MICRLLLFIIAVNAVFSAELDLSAVRAEHAEVSIRTGETIFTGNPRVDYGDIRLTADELRINFRTKIVVAVGHAVLTRGSRRLLADTITYNANDGTYEVGDLRVGDYPVYLTGSSATGNADSITVMDARATIPQPGPWVPTI